MVKVQDESRIRICLGHCLGYLLVLATLVALYLFFKSHILLTTVMVAVVLPICSVASAWLMHPYLSVEIRAVQSGLREGQEGIWRIQLHNDSYGLALSCSLSGTVQNTFLGTSGELRLEMPISMKSTEYMDLPLGAQYCGMVRVEISRMEYLDPMGLLKIQVPVESSGECAVLPNKGEETSKRRAGYRTGISEAEETLSKGHDFSEVTDMREYRPGDQIKDIHWKLSAKKQELMVKERASVAQSQVILLLDLSGEYEAISRIVGLAYGLAGGFLETYIPVRLLWWDEVSYDFSEVLIAAADERDSGFGTLLSGRSCRGGQDLPLLLQRVRPAIQSYVYLHLIGGEADGEVMSHV